MLLLATWNFVRIYGDFSKGQSIYVGLDILAGTYFLMRGIKRFQAVRQAKREGRDPTILRTKVHG